MKKYLLLFIVAVSISVGYSQETTGQVFYDVDFESDSPEASQFMERMENSELKIFFLEQNVRSEFYMGDIMTQYNITKEGEDSVLMLMDGMMGKIAMKSPRELDEENLSSMEKAMIPETVQLLEDETKKIIGYTCYKAIVTMKDGNDFEVWYTKDIVPENRKAAYLYEDIPGMPLEMNGDFGNMQAKFIAYKFKKKIKQPEQLFDMEIPNGFTVRTAEEMRAMQGGGE